jgi:hypothetical protein
MPPLNTRTQPHFFYSSFSKNNKRKRKWKKLKKRNPSKESPIEDKQNWWSEY